MFEYKVVEAKNAKDAEAQMNKHAREGWRVMHILTEGAHHHTHPDLNPHANL